MPLELEENAKYLGMSTNFDIPWDFFVCNAFVKIYFITCLCKDDYDVYSQRNFWKFIKLYPTPSTLWYYVIWL